MKLLSIFPLILLSISSFSQNLKKEIKKATDLYNNKNYIESISILNKVLTKDTVNYEALVARGKAYNEIDSIILSYKDFTKAINHYPDSATAYYFRGIFFIRILRSDLSIEDFSQALNLMTNDSMLLETYLNRGIAKQQKRDFQGAFEDYYNAYLLDTNNVESMNNMATVLDDLGRRDETIRYLKRCVQLKPKYIGGWINLGYHYSVLTRYPEALEYLNKAVDLEPDNAIALSNRAYTRLMLEDYQGALSDINKSIELYPGNSYAYRNRALICIAMEDRQKACADIEAGLKREFTKVYGEELLELKKKHCK